MKLKTFAKSWLWKKPAALEYDLRFRNREEWMGWWNQHQPKPSQEGPEEIGRRILKRGFQEPLTGRKVTPSQLAGSEPFGTEALFVNGLNCRQRAVLKLIEEATVGRQPHEFAIFSAEAITALALVLRGRFARFVGSEYAANAATRSWLYPILHQDLCALDLPDRKFDLVVTNDVLEHVPDIDRALAEMARVLIPGGWHIGTVPFLYFGDVGDRRALLENGKVMHLKEPEWHGNPVDDKGSLVFEIPAWDLLDRAKAAGFSNATMRFVASESAGIMTNVFGVFVLCAQR